MANPGQAGKGSVRRTRRSAASIGQTAAEGKPATAVAAPEPAAAAMAQPANDAMFRDAIFAAASEVGADGTGTDGLKGYLRKIANEDPKTYFGLLAKLMLGEAANATQETVTRIERVIVRARE